MVFNGWPSVEIDEKTKIRVKLGKRIYQEKMGFKKGDLCGLKLLLEGIIIHNRNKRL
jgi:hypothetical protein